MTKHSYLKQEIRARMAITGESYSVAARAIAKEEPLPAKEDAFHIPSREQAELRSLVIFTERLTVLLSGGMNLEKALVISEQTTEDPTLKLGIQEVLGEHRSGEPLEKSIGARPWAFPGIFSAVISEALNNGSLSEAMRLMAKLYRTEMELETPKHPSLDSIRRRNSTKGRNSLTEDDGFISPVEIGNDRSTWATIDDRPLVAFIGPRVVGEALARIRSQLRFRLFDDTNQLYSSLEKNPEAAGISGIFIVDKLFDPQARDKSFEKFGATMAPYCFYAVLSYDEKLREPIRDRIREEAADLNSPEAEIYFIDVQIPRASTEDAIQDFVLSEPPLAKTAADALSVSIESSLK